jgi:predicted nucleic acid-binding Zn finger protein
MNKGYYCINETKSICHFRETSLEPYYYLLPEINYPCYNLCDNLVTNCLRCNQTICNECTKRYIVNDNGTYCFVKPFDVPDDDKCLIKYIPYNKSIYEIDPWDYADYYWNNIPYISLVDHYVGENYTITVFTNSECTELLLNDGYFKIDSKELQNKMIKEARIEGMKILFSVFINYNHKNHFSYYDLETKYLVPNKYCPSCFDIDYNITNKLNYTLNDVLGTIVTNLIISEKVEFIDRDSNTYNDICKNVTFFGIDLPLRKRLNYLYLHNYTEQILCNAENCTLVEYEYENFTVTCKCKFGNDFKEIFTGEKFEFSPYEGQPTELNNDFIDSLEIIKCTINGFKSNNIKANIGFFISIIAIAGQIVLFIYYCICSKSIVNINKNVNINMSNPPKKKLNTSIMIISDWERNTRDNNKISEENEVYVQSRDDAEDQLLEEEKSYSKDGDLLDASSLSIDTNVGGAIRNISTGNKKNIKEKADNKRVLILLSNKGKNKSKNLKEDLMSDSDIIPLEDDKKVEIKNFFRIYWYVLSLKQHIINFFSNINCCKITESYIPISVRLIRSIFMIILTFVLNILWLNQTYYENKFEYFNNEYKFIYTQVENKVPTGKRFSYAFSNTFIKGILSFAILLVVQFLIGFIFFSVRNNVIKAKRQNNDDAIQDVVSCTLKKYIIFFIINLALMIIFLMTLTGFCGAYGGGFVDYFIASIISLIFLEIFPFLWSIVIALFIYFGYKKDIKWLKKISHFFMF